MGGDLSVVPQELRKKSPPILGGVEAHNPTIAEMHGNRGYQLNALILASVRKSGGFDLLDRLRRNVLVL